MLPRPLVLTLACLTLALVACSPSEPTTGPSAGTEAPTGAAADGDTQDQDATAGGVDLDPDLAARVDGVEISRAVVEQRVRAAIAGADEQRQAELEGEQGELVRAQLRARALTELIQGEIVLAAATELDALPTPEQVQQVRATLEAESGGADEFAAAIAEAGLEGEALQRRLMAVAALDSIAEALEARGEVPDEPTTDEQGRQLSPSQQAVQAFIGQRFAEAEVVIQPDIGAWNPELGGVVPPPDAIAPPPGER